MVKCPRTLKFVHTSGTRRMVHPYTPQGKYERSKEADFGLKEDNKP